MADTSGDQQLGNKGADDNTPTTPTTTSEHTTTSVFQFTSGGNGTSTTSPNQSSPPSTTSWEDSKAKLIAAIQTAAPKNAEGKIDPSDADFYEACMLGFEKLMTGERRNTDGAHWFDRQVVGWYDAIRHPPTPALVALFEWIEEDRAEIHEAERLKAQAREQAREKEDKQGGNGSGQGLGGREVETGAKAAKDDGMTLEAAVAQLDITSSTTSQNNTPEPTQSATGGNESSPQDDGTSSPRSPSESATVIAAIINAKVRRVIAGIEAGLLPPSAIVGCQELVDDVKGATKRRIMVTNPAFFEPGGEGHKAKVELGKMCRAFPWRDIDE